MSYSDIARGVIAKVDQGIPPDVSFAERKRAIRDAYPFGLRAHWPYKAWCKAQRAYLARHDPKNTGPLFAEAGGRGG